MKRSYYIVAALFLLGYLLQQNGQFAFLIPGSQLGFFETRIQGPASELMRRSPELAAISKTFGLAVKAQTVSRQRFSLSAMSPSEQPGRKCSIVLSSVRIGTHVPILTGVKTSTSTTTSSKQPWQKRVSTAFATCVCHMSSICFVPTTEPSTIRAATIVRPRQEVS